MGKGFKYMGTLVLCSRPAESRYYGIDKFTRTVTGTVTHTGTHTHIHIHTHTHTRYDWVPTHDFPHHDFPQSKSNHVAIDCCGYGCSPGDRQTIRNYAPHFLRKVMHSVFVLVGSSQGACSVSNAIIDQPSLASFMTVQDPVTHAPERFTSIEQPVLLIYDTNDPGHPVSVRRRVKQVLQRPFYFEHSSEQQPFYHELNMGKMILDLFDWFPKLHVKRVGRDVDHESLPSLPFLGLLSGGVRTWY